jgi:hypothetical protein
MGNYPTSGQNAYYIKQSEDKKLGEGSFAKVYKLTMKKTKVIYAGKFFKLEYGDMDTDQKLG